MSDDQTNQSLDPDPTAKLDGEIGEIDERFGRDLDLGTLDPALADSSLTQVPAASSASRAGGGAKSRTAGMLALVLGVSGGLLSIVFLVLFVRFGFGADDAVNRVMAPVDTAVDRLDARIDQVDDLAHSANLAGEKALELRARVDGLVDVATSASRSYQAIVDSPGLGMLPETDLRASLASFEEAALRVDAVAGTGDTVDAAGMEKIGDEIDAMQSRVAGAREAVDSATSTLTRWLRLAAFAGFVGSLWSLWGQTILARRGWRGLRGRAL